ncbi:hypothetical protein PpBr36_04466 [Pyricularia pennisetigena]|uniref:hypothetical protein n=1 Tax=Pyricularia pennisetigena TaxID=1578925 RepID=UPI001154A2DA|nr:hypothetical protein PpBr36_04466 [Pyricularia pennisetigena]TLS27192.1 hypothetical protein PpBr36_04466 [Pyricularia pennisetigena]
MPSQRPFFLTSVFAAFRQQTQPLASTSSQQPGKQSSTSTYSTAAVARSTQPQQQSSATSSSSSSQQQTQPATAGASQHHQQSSPGVQSPRTATTGIPIPAPGRRRGSDSSTEGFQNVRGAEKWYVGGRTATGEERFFRLGVIRRVRSGDRLSLDRLSL